MGLMGFPLSVGPSAALQQAQAAGAAGLGNLHLQQQAQLAAGNPSGAAVVSAPAASGPGPGTSPAKGAVAPPLQPNAATNTYSRNRCVEPRMENKLAKDHTSTATRAPLPSTNTVTSWTHSYPHFRYSPRLKSIYTIAASCKAPHAKCAGHCHTSMFPRDPEPCT